MQARSVPTFKTGTFLPLASRTLVILALCAIWAIALWIVIYPIGQHFVHTQTVNALVALTESNADAAQALGFLESLWLGMRALFMHTPIFLGLWLVATMANSLRLLRKQKAFAWLGAMFALLHFGHCLLEPSYISTQEQKLFPPEHVLVPNMPNTIAGQRAALETAWLAYRDATFTGPTDSPETNFNLARLVAMQADGPYSWAPVSGTLLASFLLGLSVLLVWVEAKIDG